MVENHGPAAQRVGALKKEDEKKMTLFAATRFKKHDWLVVERVRSWKTKSTKIFKELQRVVVRKTVSIAHRRIIEAPSAFGSTLRVFGGDTGGECTTPRDCCFSKRYNASTSIS